VISSPIVKVVHEPKPRVIGRRVAREGIMDGAVPSRNHGKSSGTCRLVIGLRCASPSFSLLRRLILPCHKLRDLLLCSGPSRALTQRFFLNSIGESHRLPDAAPDRSN